MSEVPVVAVGLKRFFKAKGYGFVAPERGGDNVFVHIKDNPALCEGAVGSTCTFNREFDCRKEKYQGVNVAIQFSDLIRSSSTKGISDARTLADTPF